MYQITSNTMNYLKSHSFGYRMFIGCVAVVMAACLSSAAFVSHADGNNESIPLATTAPTDCNPSVATNAEGLQLEVIESVVIIADEDGFGSGVIVSEDGFILTNYHVVESMVQRNAMTGTVTQMSVLRCTMENGRPTAVDGEFTATLLRVDPNLDLALLRMDNINASLPFVTFSERVSIGEDCYAIGSQALGLAWAVRRGNVAAIGEFPSAVSDTVVERTRSGAAGIDSSAEEYFPTRPASTIIHSTCAISPGDSGGPLLNSNGELIGLTFATPANLSGGASGFHIAINEIRNFLSSLPIQPEPAPFDVWTAGYGYEVMPFASEIINLPDSIHAAAMRVIYGDTNTGHGVAVGYFVKFDFGLEQTDLEAAPSPFGLWSSESEGTFRFDIFVIERADGAFIIGRTDVEGVLNTIVIDQDNDGRSDLIWQKDQQWSYHTTAEMLPELMQLTSNQQARLEWILRKF